MAVPTPVEDRAAQTGVNPIGRLLHAGFVLVVVAFVIVPNIPAKHVPLASTLAKWAKTVSFKQGWQMYAPNP